MLSAETIHPEGPRYAASLVLVPGLWTPADACRRFAGYLAHRGWESHVVDLERHGGVVARGTAVASYAAELSVPPILIGHDAGAWVALEAAVHRPPAAVVLLAPLDPGAVTARSLGLSLGAVLAVLLGRGVSLAPGVAPADAPLLRDLLWRRWAMPQVDAPVLSVPGSAPSLLGSATWQATADRVHRWLVQQLGAPLLELYPEAMAERDEEE
jgi:pimeloyl-ACP methyl ester carboxylesterase